MDNKCAMCPRPGDLCAGCKDIRYCCRAHQKDDWPTHKLVCRKFALRHKLPHPGKTWVLHFPVDREEPEFRMIRLNRWGYSPDWKGISLDSTYCRRINGCSSACRCTYTTYEDGFVHSSAHDPLCQYVYVDAPEQRSQSSKRKSQSLEVNQCIKTLTGDTSWKGPVIAFAEDIYMRHMDMRTSVFNRILKEFHDITGVRINCDELVEEHNVPRFEAVTIKSSDLSGGIFDQDRHFGRVKTCLTWHTGVVLQAAQETYWRSRQHSHSDSKNTISQLMSIPCEISKHNFGYYESPRGTGNVIVIREDKKPLHVEYVEVLCSWILNDLRPLFKQVRAENTEVTRQGFKGRPRTTRHRAIRQKVFQLINKQSLLAYSGGRLIDEDTEEAEDEEMADIVENEDTTDDEMPEDGKEVDTSDDDDDMFDDESSDIQGGDDAE